APDMYAAAARALGAEPSRTLAFEDSGTGARSAQDAGLRLIAVPAGGHDAPPADLVVPSLPDPDLRAWIATWWGPDPHASPMSSPRRAPAHVTLVRHAGAIRCSLDPMSTSSDPSTPLTARAHGSALRGRGWLNTGGAELDLEALRGKIVLLDFWTFCCVNCLHVLDELRPLEEKWAQELVVIGVHSPKFEFEKDPEALAANIERYEVSHPVID